MSVLDIASGALLLIGAMFFFAGTLGLLRFPDVYTRLHALAKADNLGLGFTVFGLALQATSVAMAIKLVLVWLLVLGASAAVSFLIARRARARGVPIWTREAPRQ